MAELKAANLLRNSDYEATPGIPKGYSHSLAKLGDKAFLSGLSKLIRLASTCHTFRDHTQRLTRSAAYRPLMYAHPPTCPTLTLILPYACQLRTALLVHAFVQGDCQCTRPKSIGRRKPKHLAPTIFWQAAAQHGPDTRAVAIGGPERLSTTCGQCGPDIDRPVVASTATGD